jgi:hypothetical protein
MEPTPTSISTDGGGDSAYNRVSRIRKASKRSLVEPYTPECVEFDFSHLGVWQIASAKASMNAPGTFCGSRCARATRKKSQSLRSSRKPKPPPPQRRRRRREDTPPKGRGPEDRVLGTSEWPVSEPCKLPCQGQSRALSPGAPLPWRGWATSTLTLSAPKWLKSRSTRLGE